MANLLELVKQLRDQTGAGMMDCKNLASNNDLSKAVDWLREKVLLNLYQEIAELLLKV